MEGESQRERDVRIKKLWNSLHTRAGEARELDFKGLEEGLRKINHPLQDADGLLRDIFKKVDTSGDGHIQYLEFLTFVEKAEYELWQMFKSIDRDENGRLDKHELRLAFDRASIAISSARLEQFFDEVDANGDGTITFDEWRNFLLFLPALTPNLNAILSYYSSTVSVNPEGDVHVSDEAIHGLATALDDRQTRFRSALYSQQPTFPWDPGETASEIEVPQVDKSAGGEEKPKLHMLTSLLPEPGYFVAGGVAGAISRTATAPLDRLKVYLIAQTSAKMETVEAVRSGSPFQALRSAVRPLKDACVELWGLGGIRSLFAGNGLNVIKVMPESAIKFGSYEGSKRIMARLEGHDDPRGLSGISQFFSAGTGGMISQFAIYPLDTLKFRMQCETVKGGLHGNKLIFATAQQMWSKGVLTFYRGLGMGLIGMFPYSAIDLTTYEYLKRFIIARNMRTRNCTEEEGAPGKILTGAIGALSSSFGASAVYPLNLLRTRLQSQGTAIHPPTYNGWRDCAAKTIKGEGARGLYKGLTPNLLKVVPAMSISYIVYESSKKLMGLN